MTTNFVASSRLLRSIPLVYGIYFALQSAAGAEGPRSNTDYSSTLLLLSPTTLAALGLHQLGDRLSFERRAEFSSRGCNPDNRQSSTTSEPGMLERTAVILGLVTRGQLFD